MDVSAFSPSVPIDQCQYDLWRPTSAVASLGQAPDITGYRGPGTSFRGLQPGDSTTGTGRHALVPDCWVPTLFSSGNPDEAVVPRAFPMLTSEGFLMPVDSSYAEDHGCH